MFGEIVLNFWYNSGIPPYLNGEAMFFEPEVSLGVCGKRCRNDSSNLFYLRRRSHCGDLVCLRCRSDCGDSVYLAPP
jgi:hypothetical protein